MYTILRQHIEKIVPLTNEEYEQIQTYFTFKKFRKHQFVVQEGNAVEQEYFVLKGLLKAFYINAEGKDHIIQFAMEDWWITDYQAQINRNPATLNIDCIEDTELLCITFERKNELCQAFHKMEHFFRIKSAYGYIALQQRILSFLNNDAQSRYTQLLRQYPALFQRVPKALIASYLGVSRETLSRF
ncbi:MAG TPA: Crp/Fnr family transcriptional regulator [Ohtaekwangia sp.]|uniref:Crp/Fnr family transcriptional regulator n=1 Tax=Ohtaekwangia sp. TaxID=2066019 RepID=UPI002F934DB4